MQLTFNSKFDPQALRHDVTKNIRNKQYLASFGLVNELSHFLVISWETRASQQ